MTLYQYGFALGRRGIGRSLFTNPQLRIDILITDSGTNPPIDDYTLLDGIRDGLHAPGPRLPIEGLGS